MTKRILAVLTIVYMIAVCVLPFIFKNGFVDEGAVREKSEGDIFYFDAEAIALSNASNEDSELRSKALEAADLINEMRENAGLETLDWDLNLEQTADVRSEEASDVFSHTRPNGNAWNTVNSKIQGGENLAYGFNDAQDVVDAWTDSPTHYDNMMYSEFTKGAISIYEDDDEVCYWANEFGF